MTRLGADAQGRRVEEISRFEHELVEASSSLKQSFDANSTYEGKMARVTTDLDGQDEGVREGEGG